jgi:endo-1,4-beta-xylanase
MFKDQTLRELAQNCDFKIGSSLSPDGVVQSADYRNVVAQHFNLLVPAGTMKIHNIRTTPTTWDFSRGDRAVEFAQQHNQSVRGHTLCWHLSVADWMKELSSSELEKVLRDYIFETVGRYRGKVQSWNVLNEAINDNGRARPSLWKKIENFIPKCYQWAHEADPDAELLYCDYRVHTVGRWKAVSKMVREMQSSDIPIHGIGLQLHHDMFRSLAISSVRLTGAILDLRKLGMNVHVAEVTVAIQPPIQNLPDAVKYKMHAAAYRQLIKASLLGGAKSFSIWGCADPFAEHVPAEATPGIFDAAFQPKPAYFALQEELAHYQHRFIKQTLPELALSSY